MTAVVESSPAAQFRRWSAAAHRTAAARQATGDLFGMRLALARAEVYSLAAALAGQVVPEKLADRCADAELAHRVAMRPAAMPLAGEDDAYLEHVRAMAWQLCARTVDPARLPVEQPW